MPTIRHLTAPLPHLLCFYIVACAMVALSAGCKKSAEPPPAQGVTVLLTNADLKADGSLTDSGLQKIAAHPDGDLTLAFVHTTLSDAGLEQLAKYPNIRRVQAVASNITPDGIAKLKQAMPQVQVSK